MDADAARSAPTRPVTLGWVQEQLLLAILDAYRTIEGSDLPEVIAHLETHGIPYIARALVQAPERKNFSVVLSQAAARLEDRNFIARTPLPRGGRNPAERRVRLLPAGRAHAETLAVLREHSPNELAGPIRTPRRPDPATETGRLWHGLEPALAEQAQELLASLEPADTLALGILLVRESMARGAGETPHRAIFSVNEVATLVKVTPSLIRLEIQRGALPASKIGHIYRITPQDLQTWLEQKRPDRRLREHRDQR